MGLAYKVSYSYQQNLSSTSATSAFSQIVTASSIGSNYGVGKLQYSNSSGQVLQLGYSPTSAVSSVNPYLSIPPSVSPVVLDVLIPANNNMFIKAVSANATSGWLTLDFFI